MIGRASAALAQYAPVPATVPFRRGVRPGRAGACVRGRPAHYRKVKNGS